MKLFYIDHRVDTMSHLAILTRKNLSAKMQLLFLDKIHETFDCDGRVSYSSHLNTIIAIRRVCQMFNKITIDDAFPSWFNKTHTITEVF